MKLKYRYSKKEDIPEDAPEGFYVEQSDGSWVADLEGAVGSEKVAEFRDANVQLKKEAEKFAPLADMEIADVVKAVETVKNLDDKKLVDAGKVEEVVAERLKASQEAHKTALDEVNAKLATSEARLTSVQIEGAMTTSAAELGVKKDGALVDVINRGKAVFSIDPETGNPVAKDANGAIMYGTDGLTPLTIKEFTERLATKEATFLFEENAGGGGRGTGSPSDPAYARMKNKNPFSAEHRNLFEQSQLIEKTPALAKRLADEAGVDLPENATPLSAAN